MKNYNTNNSSEAIITAEYIERQNDIRSLSSQNYWTEWAKENGYLVMQNSFAEIRFCKENANFDIVARNISGYTHFTIEPYYEIPELNSNMVLLGNKYTSKECYETWMSYRNNNVEEASICTRMMPGIVVMILTNEFDMKDRGRLNEICKKLSFFGSNKLPNASTRLPSEPITFFDMHTKYFVCYAPGEIEAIVDISLETICKAKDKEAIRNYDMREFAEMLADRAKEIPPTKDMAMFGRYVNNWGLKNYKSALGFGTPIQIRRRNA